MKKFLALVAAALFSVSVIADTIEETADNVGSDVYMLKYFTSNDIAAMSRGYEDVTAANIITQAECGTTFFLNSATEFASTLPSPAAGCNFRFIVRAAPVGAAYTIVTPGGGNLIDGTTVVNGAVVGCVDEDTITFTASAAISGDWVSLWSDGTNWYVTGQAFAATGIACSAT